jgi:DNA-binding beta-propeller fold protein YncE
MGWPLSQDYNEAIQSPATSFRDPELRQGEAVLNPLGLPLPRSGNFADVYETTCPGGAKWAVKCFTRPVAGQHERYAAISRHLQDVRLPFAVAFQYLDEGIRVRGRWYPVLKMRWVEGLLLNEFVRDNVDRPALLENLLVIWARMARRLREGRLAHGDLQHGNVLLVPGSKSASLALRLIDYDGMYVPALAAQPSGEVGHPNFQHPARAAERAYHLKIDRFPLLQVATALRALTVGGRALWERYDNGDNLLFRECDLRAPAESPLFAELRRLSDPLAQSLAGQLQRACAGRLEDVPFVCDLLPEEKPARAAAPAGAITASQPAAVALPEVEEQEAPDWDFGDPTALVSVRKPRQGVPTWVWAVGGAAALALVVAGVGVGAVTYFLTRKSARPAKSVPAVVAKADPQNEAVPPVDRPQPGGKPPGNERPPEGPAPEPDKGGVPMPPQQPVLPAPPPQRRPPFVPPPVAPAQPAAPAATLVREFPAHSALDSQVAVSPDGKLLLSSTEVGQIWLYEVETGTLRHKLSDTAMSPGRVSVAFLPNQRAVSAGADKLLQVWNLTTGKAVSKAAQPNPVLRLAVSPDGRRLAVCGQGDMTVLVSDVRTRRVTHQLPSHKQGCPAAAFTPDSKRLLTTDVTGRLHVWDLARTRQAPRTFQVASLCPYAVRVTPDGRSALVGDQGGTVKLYDLATGQAQRQFDINDRVAASGIDISPDGRLALVGGMSAVHVFDLATAKELYRCPGHSWVSGVAFLPDKSRRFVSTDRKAVRLWRLPDEKSELAQAAPAGKDGRLPVPDAGDLAAAEKQVQAAYAAELADTGHAAVNQMVLRMLDRGRQAQDAPAFRFALLRLARDKALTIGFTFGALNAAQIIADQFAVNPVAQRLAVIEAMAPGVKPGGGWVASSCACKVLEEGCAADEYDLAVRAGELARTFLAGDNNAKALAAVERRLARAQALRGEYEKSRNQVRILAINPLDTGANYAVGGFRCYRKGDWAKGLPLLARTSDAELNALATRDMQGPRTPQEQAALGEQWWQRGAKESGEAQAATRERGLYWLRRALPGLKGAERERAEGRLRLVRGTFQGTPGLVAELFADADFQKKTATRIDPRIDLGSGTTLPADVQSVRWTGWLVPPEDAPYALHLHGKGNFRWYLDERPIGGGGPDGWIKGVGVTATRDLAAKPHRLRIEYRRGDGPPQIIFRWSLPGVRAEPEFVPLEALYHDAEQAKALEP